MPPASAETVVNHTKIPVCAPEKGAYMAVRTLMTENVSINWEVDGSDVNRSIVDRTSTDENGDTERTRTTYSGAVDLNNVMENNLPMPSEIERLNENGDIESRDVFSEGKDTITVSTYEPDEKGTERLSTVTENRISLAIVDDTIVMRHDITTEHYDESGKMTSIEFSSDYNNDRTELRYDEDGKLTDKIEYKDGEIDTHSHYREDGSLEKTESYEKGNVVESNSFEIHEPANEALTADDARENGAPREMVYEPSERIETDGTENNATITREYDDESNKTVISMHEDTNGEETRCTYDGLATADDYEKLEKIEYFDKNGEMYGIDRYESGDMVSTSERDDNGDFVTTEFTHSDDVGADDNYSGVTVGEEENIDYQAIDDISLDAADSAADEMKESFDSDDNIDNSDNVDNDASEDRTDNDSFNDDTSNDKEDEIDTGNEEEWDDDSDDWDPVD